MAQIPIDKISIHDKRYPELLKKIPDAPAVLYAQGRILAKERCFAIVGTRRCSTYGKHIAMEIAGDLTEAGFTIVSGLAPGIDTAAHRAAVERDRRTIAVLGSGIDEKSLYPKENILLARKIVEKGGAVLSEYPPGTPASKITFPRRNRIISGLSLGTLVVEAKRKSGALITAEYTKKQGRKLFAVPGSIHSPNSRGPHFLLKKKGAILAENAEDVVKAFGLQKRTQKREIPHPQNEEERLIAKVLAEEPLDIEQIIEKSGLSPTQAIRLISAMEIQGKIKNLGKNVYAISNS